MAQHNPQSRTYLVVVLAAAVVCFVIAQLILGHHGGSHSDDHHGAGHKAETSSMPHEDTTHTDEKPQGAKPAEQH